MANSVRRPFCNYVDAFFFELLVSKSHAMRTKFVSFGNNTLVSKHPRFVLFWFLLVFNPVSLKTNPILYTETYHPTRPLHPLLVTESLQPDVLPALGAHQIDYLILTP